MRSALRVLEEAARRAHGRTYSPRTIRVARKWQYPDGAVRLVPAPVFVLSSMRSGSTLLRRMLDNHSRICAPHEMHLSTWRVETDSKNARAALNGIGMTPDELANLLWDRVMHLQLVEAQKSIIVDKTPRNTLLWRRIAAVWPDARFLILLRHPARVAESLTAARPTIPAQTHFAELERYAVALAEAQRGTKYALTVRYEDLTTEPEETTKRITEWLGVPWEVGMASFGAPNQANGNGRNGHSAEHAPRHSFQPDPDPSTVPEGLRKACELLGYV